LAVRFSDVSLPTSTRTVPLIFQKDWVYAACIALLASAGFACDSGSHGKDASTVTSQRLAQVSVRLDLPSGGAPSVSVLAFRAEAIDMATSDVLGAVDSLGVARA